MFLSAGFLSFAQEAATAVDRPPETELLLNTTPENAGTGQAPVDMQMPGVGFGDFIRVIIVLAVVIAFIYAFVWMLKRFTGKKAEGSVAIRLYSTQPLKGDAALHLIEAGKRIYLIGSSGSSVNLISEIDDKESIDEIHMNASLAPTGGGGGFARLFKNRFGSAVAESDVSDKTVDTDHVSFLRKQRERLKDL
ncbi:MAG: hypothetical protein DRZ90_07115 [Spirochaetes bacterium]|nr:MAG: hypothetical protein DRZ90_07115 [Spirochaetota bacterium]